MVVSFHCDKNNLELVVGVSQQSLEDLGLQVRDSVDGKMVTLGRKLCNQQCRKDACKHYFAWQLQAFSALFVCLHLVLGMSQQLDNSAAREVVLGLAAEKIGVWAREIGASERQV
jgi:hypothetical protein